MRHLVKRPVSPSMIVALLALLVALSGTGYAAATLAENSVGSPQLKAGAVHTSDLQDEAVTFAKTDPGLRQAQRALRSGETMRGTFAAGGGGGSSQGFIGTGVTFPYRLPGDFNRDTDGDDIVDTVVYVTGSGFTNKCPSPGQAAPGYACFYEQQAQKVTFTYLYDDDYDSPSVGRFGTRMYWLTTGATNYVDGTWAITAR